MALMIRSDVGYAVRVDSLAGAEVWVDDTYGRDNVIREFTRLPDDGPVEDVFVVRDPLTGDTHRLTIEHPSEVLELRK